MLDFIQTTATRFDLSEDVARALTVDVLRLIRDQVPFEQFDRLISGVPGASELVRGAGPNDRLSGGGTLGRILSRAASAVAPQGAIALDTVGLMKSSGLAAGRCGEFVGWLADHLAERTDGDLVASVLGAAPGLRALLEQDQA